MTKSHVEKHRDPSYLKSRSQNDDDEREDANFLEVSPSQQRRAPSLV